MMNKMCMAAVIAASLYAGTTFAQPVRGTERSV